MADTASNPDALQQEVERTRDELARTIDTIVDRAHPRNVARRGVAQVKENASSVRKKLPGGNHDGGGRSSGGEPAGAVTSGSAGPDEATRVIEAPGSAGSDAAGSGPAGLPGRVTSLATNRTAIAVGVGVIVVVSAVITWRRLHN